MKGKIPATLGKLKRLKKLELQNNQLIGELPKIVSGWEVLEEINLSNNKHNLYYLLSTNDQLF